MLCDLFSLVCNFATVLSKKKLLSDAYIGMAGPYLAISGVTKEGHLSPCAACLGRQIEFGMLRNNYKLGWFK